MKQYLKIVHCGNFSYFSNGAAFNAHERKISYGLINQGHFVYDFSYRDQARCQRFLGFKKKSIDIMNQNLIDTCMTIQPDLLLLGKAEFVYADTLKKIKELIPAIKIAQWFVDDFVREADEVFLKQFHYTDCFFQTSAAELQELSFKFKNLVCSYMPNITDNAFEQTIVSEKIYDVIYIARDHKEDERYKFAVMLNAFCKKNHLNLKIYGSLGNPTVFGQHYYDEIAKAKIAVNFNRNDRIEGENKDKFMGSSDRMNHFMGTGTCTFSPNIRGLDTLYKDNEDVVYFDGAADCFEKIVFYLENDRYERIAQQGNKKAYKVSNAKKVTKYFLETIFGEKYSMEYEWMDLRYQNGKKYE
ncbi:MAG: glycosyltransferase [Sulfurovum sp.]|nr:glycosyltransferase [Sulfurovum sp.]